ncbi:MAG: 4-hydroxy-tetrahydrodipicolinate reductase [Synergistes sp.]|nr:4-hydroxy-tetrahydrodipicolinate reductase [Synergistes sp.]
MIRVFLSGASGNVGRAIVRDMPNRSDFSLVGGWCLEAGRDLGELAGTEKIGICASGDLEEALAGLRPDVVLDFSSARVMDSSLSVYLKLGLNAVIGTTGLTEEKLARRRAEVEAMGLRWTVIPNYCLGMALVADFVRRARRYYPFVTITDRHTNEMANAPSGTSALLATLLAAEKPEIKSSESYPGALGADICGVPVFSERLPLPGPYSEHRITLARNDELLTVTLQDHTSEVYLDGIFLAAGRISSLPAGSFIRDLAELMEL